MLLFFGVGEAQAASVTGDGAVSWDKDFCSKLCTFSLQTVANSEELFSSRSCCCFEATPICTSVNERRNWAALVAWKIYHEMLGLSLQGCSVVRGDATTKNPRENEKIALKTCIYAKWKSRKSSSGLNSIVSLPTVWNPSGIPTWWGAGHEELSPPQMWHFHFHSILWIFALRDGFCWCGWASNENTNVGSWDGGVCQ